MKTVSLAVLVYVGAMLAGCAAAAGTSIPFLRSGDFGISGAMLITAFMSAFYILTFAPLVVAAEVLIRGIKTHLVLPLASIPTFGAGFPVLGFVLFPGRWWPEEPADMRLSHLSAFLVLAIFSIGVGILFTLLSDRRKVT